MQHNDQPQVADINYLYREAIDARDNLRDMKQQVDDVSDERLGLYDAFGAITGLVDPQHPKLVEKQVGGVLQRVFGKGSAKYGTVQRKLLSRQVDLVGRAVVVPNPDLDIDSVGLPENRAWPLYNEFVVGRLRRRGFPVARAMAEVQNRTPLAREELLREMEKRPVYVDRAPVLHRFGTLAFYPRLVAGDSMHVSPAVLTGFAMDFDGDTAQYHVPANDEAIPEILERMLPSRNLLSPADFKTPMPVAGKEFIGGLFTATKPAREGARVVRFLNRKAAIEAARRGELPLDTPVEVDD
jgi:DNA-directed RNA polymerase subunit beta'